MALFFSSIVVYGILNDDLLTPYYILLDRKSIGLRRDSMLIFHSCPQWVLALALFPAEFAETFSQTLLGEDVLLLACMQRNGIVLESFYFSYEALRHIAMYQRMYQQDVEGVWNLFVKRLYILPVNKLGLKDRCFYEKHGLKNDTFL